MVVFTSNYFKYANMSIIENEEYICQRMFKKNNYEKSQKFKSKRNRIKLMLLKKAAE